MRLSIADFKLGLSGLMRITCLLCGLFAFEQTFAAQAGLNREVTFKIPSQRLAQAILEFSDQAGIQVISSGKDVVKVVTSGVNGKLRVVDALGALLRGTGLKFNVLDDHTVSIRPLAPSTTPSTPATSAVDGAQGDAAQDELRLADGAGPNAGDTAAKGTKDKNAKRADDGVEEMLVEGEREKPAPFSTANLDLTRTEDDVLPFTTFTARDIQLSGVRTLQGFLRERLPQNFTSTIAEEQTSNGVPYISQGIDLRGWGAKETVILLNGRRMGKESLDYGSSSTDLATIPLGSIERIEILPSAGGAIYGAGATGGVINIITRTDYQGGRVAVSYESPADTHTPQRSVTASYGLPLPRGFGLRFSGGYNDSAPLKAGDRSGELVARYRKRQLATTPYYPYGYPIFGATPNIASVGDEGYQTGSYGSLFGPDAPFYFSSFTTVPDGYRGYPAGGGLSAFTPGTFNFDLAPGSAGSNMYAQDSILGPVAANDSITVGLDKKIGSHWDLSLDYRRASSHYEGRPDLSLRFVGQSDPDSPRPPALPAAAPSNPFGVPVTVLLIDPLMNRPELTQHGFNIKEELSTVLKAHFGEWRGVASLAISRDRSHGESNTYWEPIGGWLNALMSGTYNPLVDMRAFPAAEPEFYEHYVAQYFTSGNVFISRSAMLKLSGPAWKLPAGPLQLTAGVDWNADRRVRGENTNSGFRDSLTHEPLVPSGGYPPMSRPEPPYFFHTRHNYGVYAEVNVPLIAAAQRVPLANKLELFSSGRVGYATTIDPVYPDGIPYKHTSKFPTHVFGLSYAMVEDLTFRGSRSIGFLPVPIYQTTPAEPQDPNRVVGSVDDPLRFNGTVREHVELRGNQLLGGGNPDLRPETSNSRNLGVIITPRWVPGLRLSVDYLESIRNDAITNIGPQFVVDNAAALPGRLRRGAPDVSGVGRIEFVDSRVINLNQLASRSVDFSFGQSFENVLGGQLSLSASASRMLSFKVQVVAGGPKYEQVRSRSRDREGRLGNTYAAWNANAQLGWTRQQWSFGWNTRFYDSILVDEFYGSDSEARTMQGSDRAPWKLNHDINVSYRMARQDHPRGMQRLLSNTSIAFGVTNVLNRQPRFWYTDFDRGVAPYDSLAGRSYWLNASREF